MKTLYERLFRESGIYSLQPFLVKAISIFLIPLYTAYLTTEQYGQFAFIFSLGAFAAPFINLGQTTTFWKYYTSADSMGRKKVIFQTAFIKLSAGIALTALAVVPMILIHNTSVLIIAHIGGLALFTLFKTVQNYLRADHRPGLYVTSAVLFSLLLVAANIVFVVFMKLDSRGVVLGLVSVHVLFGIFGFFVLKRIAEPDFNWGMTRSMIKYGLPLAFGNLAAFLLGFSDKIMVKVIAGDAALGLYAFSFKFGQLFLAFIITPFFLGWNPTRWEVAKRRDAKEVLAGLGNAFNILMPALALLSAGVLMLAGSFLSLSSQYLEGLRIVPLITLGFCCFGMYYFDSMGILFSGRTRKITLITSLTAVLNIVLNLVLITWLGYVGAAIATAASYFFMRWLTLGISQRLYPIERNPLLLVLPTMVAVAGCATATALFRVDLLAEVSMSLILGGLVTGAVLLLLFRNTLGELKAVLIRWRTGEDISDDTLTPFD
jgi:O-antigen/teichoic acid export membrane protein